MAFTLNNIASDKENTAAKRGDAIRVNLSAIQVVDGTVDVVSEGNWRLFTPSPVASGTG